MVVQHALTRTPSSRSGLAATWKRQGQPNWHGYPISDRSMLPLHSPRSGGDLRADVVNVPLIAALQLGVLSPPSIELGLAARSHKDLPVSHHRYQQPAVNTGEWRIAVGLCAHSRGTPDNWLPEYQAAAHDRVSRLLLWKSIRGRVCAILFLSPLAHALYGEPRKYWATARMSDINCPPCNNCEYGGKARSTFRDFGRQRGNGIRYVQRRPGFTRRPHAPPLG